MDIIKLIFFLVPSILIAVLLFTFVVVPIYQGNLSWQGIKNGLKELWETVLDFVKDTIANLENRFSTIKDLLVKFGLTTDGDNDTNDNIQNGVKPWIPLLPPTKFPKL